MIDVKNLWMKYGNSDTMVVKGNSFTIKEGQLQYYDCTVKLSETCTIRVFVHYSKRLSIGERIKLHIKPQFCNIIRKDVLE